ncbi:MAG: ParB/RepB/Spo0J family partition protein [Opitutales bacterium]|nr:ParB/RepB/Spo0J family partition protein [Opitutales bacterium]
MAVRKSRLGRGLGNLISGGVSTRETPKTAAQAKKAAAKAAKKASRAGKKAAKPVPAKKTPASAAPEKAVPATSAANAAAEAPSPAAPVEAQTGLTEIAVARISPNPHQPRREFDETKLRELGDSIRAEGLLQPIVVRKVGEGFQIIAGERRWRACRELGLKRIPAHIVEASEVSSAVLSLIENLQRADLNPIEEALGYASLLKDFHLTQEAVAERVGKSRAAVANALRLLQLDREIQGFLNKGLLSVGHAKVILGLDDPAQRTLLARRIVEKGASVRETERLLHAMRNARNKAPASRDGRALSPGETAAVDDFQKRIASFLNTPVQLRHAPKRGKIVIEYFGNEDLQRILEKMGMAN